MITIWFESHATTIDNEAKVASGWNDVDLSEAGYQQARDLVARNLDRKLDAVLCSDLQRAIKTASPLVSELHIPLYIDKRLRECDYGDFEHQPNSLIEEERPKRITEPFPGGESYTQAMERMDSFYHWLKENFDGQTILIIGHRATQYGIEHFAYDKSLEELVRQKWSWQPGWEYELK